MGSPVHRVKRLEQGYENDGLKMINLKSFIYSLKCSWVRRIFQSESKWQNIFMSSVNKRKYFTGGTHYIYEIQ